MVWKDCLLSAKHQAQPDGYNINYHYFELFNFDRELVKCNVCDKYLLGIFYQGYKCRVCEMKCHKECLVKILNSAVCQNANL